MTITCWCLPVVQLLKMLKKMFELKYDVDWCGCFITFDKWNMQNIVDNVVKYYKICKR